MSTFSTVLKGGLSLISLIYPPAAPIIGILEVAEPYIEAAIPLVEAAITEGPGAVKAIEQSSPQLTQAIKDLAAHVASLGTVFGTTDASHVENTARILLGFNQMTPEEELAWMNSSPYYNSGGENSSQLGSG